MVFEQTNMIVKFFVFVILFLQLGLVLVCADFNK